MLKIEHKAVYQLFKHTIADKSHHITIFTTQNTKPELYTH